MPASRILKWIIPVDDREYPIRGEFLHAEPMTELELEQGANIRARQESPHEWVTVWTRVTDERDPDPATRHGQEWNFQWSYRIFSTGQSIEDSEGREHRATVWEHRATVRHEHGAWHIMSRYDVNARPMQSV